jgi:PHD/YefM family antitoxin component YafN of YafNO toxin-antitoxin module
MIHLTEDIRSLSDFKRDTATVLAHLRQSRRPMVLTVNGRAEMVVQDAESYQRVLDALERAEANAGIRRGLAAAAEGRTRPAREAMAAIKAERAKSVKGRRAAVSR